MNRRAITLAAVLALTVSPGADAAPGALDATFADDGIAQLEFGEQGTANDPATGATLAPIGVEPSGQLVLAGFSRYRGTCFGHLGCFPRGVSTLARLNPDGSPDVGFSGDGKLEGAPAAGTGALQPDGRLVAAGGGGNSVRVARLTRAGELDPTFASGGSTEIALPNTRSGPSGVQVALQGDGRMVVAAVSSEEPNSISYNLTLLRLEPDGTQDFSFGDQGFRQVPMHGYGYGVLASLKIDPVDRIYVGIGGAATVPGDFNALAVYARFDPDGARDAGFGNNGETEVPIENLPLTGEATMVLDPAGGVYGLLPGSLPTDPNADPDDYRDRAVVHLQASGQPDPAYGPNGVRPVDDRPKDSYIGGLAVQGDNLLLAATRRTKLLLGMHLADGRPDPSLGPGGWSRVPTGLVAPFGATPMTLGDGRIVVAAGDNSGPCAVVASFQSDGEPRSTGSPDPESCPRACRPTVTCPHFGRRLTIHGSRSGEVRGTLSSGHPECVAGAKVHLHRNTLRGPDPVIGRDRHLRERSEEAARYGIELPPGFGRGEVYALVKTRAKSGFGQCGIRRSRTIEIG